MAKPRVHILSDPHSVGRGIGFYTTNLIKSLEEQNDIILTSDNPEIIHYPFFDFFYPTLSLANDTKTVVTIHDVTPLMLPKKYPKGLKGTYYLKKQTQALQSVSKVLTDSNSSRKDIISKLSVPADKVVVTPLAADPVYAQSVSKEILNKTKKKYSLPDRFILYVGGANPNKNIPRLVNASVRLGVPLVLVGSEFVKPIQKPASFLGQLGISTIHPELKDLQYVQDVAADSPIIMTLGFVSNDDLSSIYRLATLYCQPSLYEGFGLPLLEAMSAGCLVVSSHTSSLPEIYPSGTISFDPTSDHSLTDALKTALDLNEAKRKNLISAAKDRSRDFTWEKTAKLTVEAYRSLF